MPEYLAPGVYVEEVDTGSKPIEGVSTSTAGAVGVTERGPVGVPILVTSWGEYRRWFGEMLPEALYGEHRFFPHAIEGFFTNAGRRVYVTRVLNLNAAANADTRLFRQQSDPAGATLLTRSIAGSPSVLFLQTGPSFPVAASDWVRVGSGSDAEYRQALAAPIPDAISVVGRSAFQRSHPVGAVVDQHGALPALVVGLALVGAHDAGSAWISATGGAGVLPDQLVQLQSAGPPATNEEIHYVRSAVDLGGGNWRIELDTPLQFEHAHAEEANVHLAFGAPVTSTTLDRTSVGGDSTLIVAANAGFATGDLVHIQDGARGEVRRIGEPHQVTLATPLPGAAVAGALVQHATRVDTGPVRTLAEAVAAGAMAFAIDDRAGLLPGDVLRIGAPSDPDVEYVLVRDVPGRLPSGVDPGRVVIGTALTRAHGGTTLPSLQIVQAQSITIDAESATLLHPAAAGATDVLTTAALVAVPTVNDLVRILVRDEFAYVRIGGHVPLAIEELTFTVTLQLPHAAPQPILVREELLDVVAIDPGVWGDRLRVATRRESTPLARSRIRTDASGIQDPMHIRLDSAAGVEPGTVLSLADGSGLPFDTPFKVVAVDRQNGYLLTLDTAIPAAAVLGSAITSLEFALGVYLLRQADPGQPSRNTQVLDTEMFRHLSLDPRHSRYVHRVLGTTWLPPADVDDDGQPLRRADQRSQGDSAYIRVRDLAQDMPEPARTTALESIRLGPELLVDVLPDGRREPAKRPLSGGDDQAAGLTDTDYVGADDPNPERRTGLNSLRNIDEISIVTVPGRVSGGMQNALIAHCELMRYRFAVLDALPPPTDSLADVQAQRQLFDTKYAALYHPWLLIPHPYPPGPGPVPDYPVPPAGHVVGIYARTDVERGVHKAPANEVVRGIVGLQRQLTKGEHDILNPYPVNINVIRDFRADSRGIRVYGGRVITSDSDWKYVNVRRLIIFIEASLDRGLQWVVFEPNAEPLWARVRRSISNFLTLVWRNGALEGTKPEEAYFVKCDRTTMTQTDIDSGRLICVVGVAPVKPAEFVIVRIGLWTAHADE